MEYPSEILTRARAKLARQKADRESQIQSRLQDAYRKVPRLQSIDQELQRNMASALQEAFSQGGDPAGVMEQARQKNRALQQERRELVLGAFPSGWLDETPVCERCGGSGYLGSTMCGCLEELCRQEQRRELEKRNLADQRFDRFRLDYYPGEYDPKIAASPRAVMEKTLDRCRRYAAGFAPGAGNLLFVGGTGLGKTFLATAIAASVMEKGCNVAYEGAISLFNKLERARFTPTEENRQEAEELTRADLLVIDDLGTEMAGAFVTSALYGLLEERLRQGKSMVITTNLTVEEFAKRYSPQIASRLYGEFSRLTFVGTDIRIRKSQM